MQAHTRQFSPVRFVCLVLSIFLLCLLTTGCRTGQRCDIANYGTLNYTQTISASPVVNSKETPFDVFRGLGQGSAVSAAPGATSTQSGSGTYENANLNREIGENGKRANTLDPEALSPLLPVLPVKQAVIPASGTAAPTGLTATPSPTTAAAPAAAKGGDPKTPPVVLPPGGRTSPRRSRPFRGDRWGLWRPNPVTM